MCATLGPSNSPIKSATPLPTSIHFTLVRPLRLHGYLVSPLFHFKSWALSRFGSMEDLQTGLLPRDIQSYSNLNLCLDISQRPWQAYVDHGLWLGLVRLMSTDCSLPCERHVKTRLTAIRLIPQNPRFCGTRWHSFSADEILY